MFGFPAFFAVIQSIFGQWDIKEVFWWASRKGFSPIMRLVGVGGGEKRTLLPSFCIQIQLCEDVMPKTSAAILLHETMCQPTEDGRADRCKEPRS